ncbi:MAG: hypothetical protein Q7J65_00250 [Candidatus Marinimicrobia bacterium]|nr:hypothetical protein [Candidatus Neomarinimicrobiota bacterium]
MLKIQKQIIRFAGIIMLFGVPIWALSKVYTTDILIKNEQKYTSRGEFNENDQTAIKNTLVFNGQGNTIITENVTFESKTFQPVEIKISDLQTGRFEEISQTEQGNKLRYRARSNAPIQEKIIPRNGITLHGSYVPMNISNKMDRIVNGEVLAFQLLIVDRLSSYEFQVRQNGIKTVDGKDYLEIILEPTSWIVKQFVPSISFYYLPDNYQKIVRYRGAIGPRDAAGNVQTGEIIFHYPPE